MLEGIIKNFPEEEFLKADGFDNAIIGFEYSTMRLIYSKLKCVEALMLDDEMDYEEAMEYLEYNTFNAYVGEKTPIWCDDTIF
jgi:hypothetical protein|tara:strand:- start:819 stop:1067 length:249 start_codon:yes stop_codon:yes gene_type:complete